MKNYGAYGEECILHIYVHSTNVEKLLQDLRF